MAAEKTRLFYGWWVVFAACLGMLLGSYSTLIGVTFALFVKPLEAAFGWSRTEIALALTISNSVIVVAAPLIGEATDRYGARAVLLVSMALLGFSISALSQLNGSLLQLYGLYLVIAIAGAGTIPTTFSRVLLDWFDRKRGLALGIALSGIGAAGILLPPAIQSFISTLGWSCTYLAMSGIVLFAAWPVVFFLFKEHPSAMGLYPDGEKPPFGISTVAQESVLGLSFRESLGSREFGLIAFGILCLGLGGTGVLIHLPAMMTDRGMTPAEAALTFSLFGATLIIGRVSCGWFVDRFFAPRVAIFYLSGPVIGIAILLITDDVTLMPLAAMFLGLGLGAEFDLLSYFISRYLGLRCYGKSYGLMYSAFSIGAGAGPLIMGLSYDRSGDYTLGLSACLATVCIAIFLISRLGEYRFSPTGEMSSASA
jgi:MFS family permease